MRTDFFLPADSLLPGVMAGPTAQTFGGSKLSHIHTDFGDNSDCGAAVNARDGAKERNSPVILLDHGVDADVHPLNQFLNVVEMVADNPNTAFLLRRNLVSLNRRENVIRLFLRERCKRETQCCGSNSSSDVR